MSRAVPTIIVLTPNTLSGIGLSSILTRILPFAAVRTYSSVEELQGTEPSEIFHLFVWSQTLIENIALFEPYHAKIIALSNGSANSAALNQYHQINVQQSEQEIYKAIESLHTKAHGHTRAQLSTPVENPNGDLLSPREIEVAKLLVEGLINKEIAAQLQIGVTTVITHRKNIFEKLGIKSLAGLTIYAIMKRYIEI